ncbi:hypothetical protein R3P38DRAFT_3132336 [Favolaschia claudopus]|uniref:Uncharacterized protein n=1 Tax=Favolaschia claudopus TaxID=2862362 RepID=A0AAV9Z8B3_9AGAR
MNTNTDHKHRNDRGQENHRNESSWNRDTHGAQTVPPPPLKSHKMNSSAQSGFNPPPQGTRTVFADDPMIVDKLAHKRERERSPQRNSREASSSRSHREEERQDRHRRSAEPATKRMKREDTPSIPGDFIPLFNDDSADEIDGLSSLSADRVPSPELVTSSSTLETEASKAKNERGPSALFDLGRSGIRALGNFISGGASGDATENDSSREQDALEAASLAQSELGHVAEQLRAAKEENQKLEEQASLLRADLRLSQEQVQRLAKKRTDNQIERSKLMEQATKDEKYIKQMEEELAKSRHEKTKHLERMQNLIQEKGVLHTQLKQLRNSCDTRPPKTVSRVSESSLNPFDNKLDQVSEAALKSGVESLNDSLETFTMKVIDDAELVALDNANARLSSVAPKEYDASNKLLAALNEHSHGEEKRGFLLDALLHQALIKELDHLFCSGDVLSHVLDENRLFVHALKELTKREPWTVAQRWRSLAASVDPLPTKWQNDSILECADSVVTLLAWAYHQPLETFQPMLTQIQSQLNKIYTEARQLSLSVRRDMLSVRMKVLVPASEGDDFLPFSSECMDAAWSDMKVVEGDAVVSPYKFGLQRTDDTGRSSLLIKPKAVTTALLRWLSCN